MVDLTVHIEMEEDGFTVVPLAQEGIRTDVDLSGVYLLTNPAP